MTLKFIFSNAPRGLTGIISVPFVPKIKFYEKPSGASIMEDNFSMAEPNWGSLHCSPSPLSSMGLTAPLQELHLHYRPLGFQVSDFCC